MGKIVNSILDSIDSFLAWLSVSLKQNTESYCDLETADSSTVLVAHDGGLASIIKIHGVTSLIGNAEFQHLHEGFTQLLLSAMSRDGHAVQMFFQYNDEVVKQRIRENFQSAQETMQRLSLDLKDLFEERANYLSYFTAEEELYLVLWTRPTVLSNEQYQQALKEKVKFIRENKLQPFRNSQNVLAAIPDLREPHEAFVRGLLNDLQNLNIDSNILKVHDAVYAMRNIADPDFTDQNWKPYLPGDKIPLREYKKMAGDISDLLWPSLGHQILPRDAEIIDLKTVKIGDRLYSTVFIDLFPKDIKNFSTLFHKIAAANIPWRISFLMESNGLSSLRFKAVLAAILSFSSAQNRLISDASNFLKHIELNTDDAVIRLRVAASTWAPEGNMALLRTRVSELAKALEGWGSCNISEISGDPFGGAISTLLGVTLNNLANPSIAPLSDVVYMLPITRPASPWRQGALLFRSPDGKLWPFQPGSSEQTTWIDLLYARPGSGKSVLSNTINLALCLSPGLQRLPRIAIIDIGPSSSGLISLLREALPLDQKHQVTYQRLHMTPEYAINPFDTQLGCRYPTAQERSFLVNFLTLLATPLGAEKPYDGIPDMAGLVVDELYKNLADDGKPYTYVAGVEPIVDGILEAINFVKDTHTTWWEVTDALFIAGFTHEAMLAQRYAMPLLPDATAICRTTAIEDLYGKVKTPTGESLISAFSRMISSAVREYPIIASVTRFDLGEARVISLDLDEVAKSGGDAADRQTAVMYMLARYVLARSFYLTEEILAEVQPMYQEYHKKRIFELREDPKRLVYDEFHRTSKALAVREQVLLDMREGRKWKVQVALISQSVRDFSAAMIEFATSIYIMDAGPAQSIEQTATIFGLSQTAQTALRTRVHGPREEGVTFLAQFSTKNGINTQLLTNTIGPIELWAFSTTVEDVSIRNQLYKLLGPAEARRVLAALFPSGTVVKLIEKRLNALKEEQGIIKDISTLSIVDQLVEKILEEYKKNTQFKSIEF